MMIRVHPILRPNHDAWWRILSKLVNKVLYKTQENCHLHAERHCSYKAVASQQWPNHIDLCESMSFWQSTTRQPGCATQQSPSTSFRCQGSWSHSKKAILTTTVIQVLMTTSHWGLQRVIRHERLVENIYRSSRRVLWRLLIFCTNIVNKHFLKYICFTTFRIYFVFLVSPTFFILYG